MDHLYVLCNQHDHFLTKSGEWNSGDENRSLYRSPHKDEAVNQMVELTVKHPDLRIRIVAVTQNERGLLQLPETRQQPSGNSEQQAEPSPPEQTDIDNSDDSADVLLENTKFVDSLENLADQEVSEHSLKSIEESANDEPAQNSLPSQELV